MWHRLMLLMAKRRKCWFLIWFKRRPCVAKRKARHSCDVALFIRLFLRGGSVAGGGPAATHFLCFAKESKQRKATAQPLPFGFPFVPCKKWETGETRFAQTTPISLSIFCAAQTAA